jgi:hypothetical protein
MFPDLALAAASLPAAAMSSATDLERSMRSALSNPSLRLWILALP